MSKSARTLATGAACLGRFRAVVMTTSSAASAQGPTQTGSRARRPRQLAPARLGSLIPATPAPKRSRRSARPPIGARGRGTEAPQRHAGSGPGGVRRIARRSTASRPSSVDARRHGQEHDLTAFHASRHGTSHVAGPLRARFAKVPADCDHRTPATRSVHSGRSSTRAPRKQETATRGATPSHRATASEP